ncbi:MAG TPA: ABC transporter permease, partial [Gemmatimonadales bacterium]|nr:ABC transporter permease [Gemmatimonadales bacterium]
MSGFYRLLLRLYPASFRSEYGPELEYTFEQSVRDRGPLAAALAAVADVVPNALLVHLRILNQDVRYGLRAMGRSPGFALTVVLVTALGVGANTATFSVADFVLLRSLPFPDPNALVRLCEGPKQGGGWGCMNELSPANYRDVAAGTSTTFQPWGAFTGASVNLVGHGEPVRVSATSVTPQVLPVLGVQPALGRGFDSTTADRDAGSAILGFGLWQTQFGTDSRVVGSTIRLDGKPFVVIGIMPPGFQFPSPDVQLWLPLALDQSSFADRTNTYLHAIGRLKPGVSFELGRADVDRIFQALSRDYPASNAETGYSYFRLRDQVLPKFRVMLLALCGASLSLLLLTSANLANLLLARAAGRERELAVRTALGAGRERLVRQLLTENILLALVGGAAGILVAVVSMPLFAHLIPTTTLLTARPSLDLRVLAIAAGLTATTGLGIGLLPAVRASRAGLGVLREGSRGGGRRQRLRSALVTAEVAISVALLISSGFLIRAIVKVQAVDPGFVADDVLTLRTQLPTPRYDDSVRRVQFYQRVLTEVAAIPGVSAAAYTSGLPMILTGGITGVAVPGADVRSARTEGVSWRLITPQFFQVLGVAIRQGRALEEADGPGRPLVV